MIAKALLQPDVEDDFDVYAHLLRQLGPLSGFVHDLTKMRKSIAQLRTQRREITREIASIASRCGQIGRLHDYVSIGDNGKVVTSLREAIGLNGKVWIVHDTNGADISAVLERRSLEPIGEFVPVDYEFFEKIEIPDDSADLVTLNQGLHHFPQDKVLPFLREVRRILRPGGMFIVREHDATPSLIPMLDLAHSVFNAVTGVTLDMEKTEIRAFRPISEWRCILSAAGFEDTYLTEMEAGDPTWDEMLCFVKPPFTWNQVIFI